MTTSRKQSLGNLTIDQWLTKTRLSFKKKVVVAALKSELKFVYRFLKIEQMIPHSIKHAGLSYLLKENQIFLSRKDFWSKTFQSCDNLGVASPDFKTQM